MHEIHLVFKSFSCSILIVGQQTSVALLRLSILRVMFWKVKTAERKIVPW